MTTREEVERVANHLALHGNPEHAAMLRSLMAERDEAIKHAKEVRRDLAASIVKSAELEAENSKLRSALEIVHFKREPWQ